MGHIVSGNGIRVDIQKIETIQSWRRPMYPTDIRSLLCLDDNYRRFFEGVSSISSPLTELTQIIAMFKWPEACEKSFQELKKRFTIGLVFTLLEDTQGFVVYYDASRVSLGCAPSAEGKHYSLCVETVESS